MTARKSSNTNSSGGAEGRARDDPFGEDLGFQVREWRLERIGWAVMVVIIVAALSGVLGGGGLVAAHNCGRRGRLDRGSVCTLCTLCVSYHAAHQSRRIGKRAADSSSRQRSVFKRNECSSDYTTADVDGNC